MQKRVMIFDDSTDLLDVCTILFTSNGFAVATNTNCDNIVEDILINKPDLVLLDLWIPKIGGEAALRLVKENELTAHIPVIIFSASTEITQLATTGHADGYVEKPFDVKTLLELVNKKIATKI